MNPPCNSALDPIKIKYNWHKLFPLNFIKDERTLFFIGALSFDKGLDLIQ